MGRLPSSNGNVRKRARQGEVPCPRGGACRKGEHHQVGERQYLECLAASQAVASGARPAGPGASVSPPPAAQTPSSPYIDEYGDHWGTCNSCGAEERLGSECCLDGEVVPYDDDPDPDENGGEGAQPSSDRYAVTSYAISNLTSPLAVTYFSDEDEASAFAKKSRKTTELITTVTEPAAFPTDPERAEALLRGLQYDAYAEMAFNRAHPDEDWDKQTFERQGQYYQSARMVLAP